MTKDEHAGRRNIEMSLWLRHTLRNSSTGLVLTDIDWILEDYTRGVLILLEVKCAQDDLSFSQNSIYNLVDNCLIFGARRAAVDYWGFYVLRMSGFSPDTSEQMTIQHGSKIKPITRDDLIIFLNFEKKLVL